MNLKAIIVDDEPNAVDLLDLRLAQHCPQIEVVAKCTNSRKAIEAVRELKPDILFLDIEMPELNGFQILEELGEPAFVLVFVTAYDRFAVKAFKYSAFDYLLKPISTSDLIEVVTKIEKRRTHSPEQLAYLKNMVTAKAPHTRIAVPFQNGVAFLQINEIMYCESDDSYTHIYVDKGNRYLVLKPLKDVSQLLEENDFVRVHRQYLVNINYIKKLVKGEGSYLVMADDKQIPVARSQRHKLQEKFNWL